MELEILARQIRQEKEIKIIQMKKEIHKKGRSEIVTVC
jgi:hypothetical protein